MRIVFSFDDNHTLNMKLANLLEKYGYRATFFINIQPLWGHKGMNPADVIKLHSRGHEIAAHTVTHTPLILQHKVNRIFEFSAGKERLRQLLRTDVLGFSYPKGQFTEEIKEETKAAGYVYARATGEGNIDPDTDRFAVVPTVQIYNDSYRRMLRIRRNILEGDNFSYTGDWKRSCKKYIKQNRGLIHIWGHSWEIEKQGQWIEFEDLLKWIKRNNYEVVNGLKDVIW